MCSKHLAQESKRSNRNQKKRRETRKINNLCTVCGKKSPVKDKKMCIGCAENVTERTSELQYRRAKSGICIDCGQKSARDGLTTCSDCKQAALVRQQNRRIKFKNQSLCYNCGERPPVPGKKRCNICCDDRNEWYADSNYKQRHADIRAEEKTIVFNHYENKCNCCDENILCFLAIDHIDGGSNEHRKNIGKAGSGFYKWLITNNFPEGFQVLCHNCNMGKHLNGGVCPHKEGQYRLIESCNQMPSVPYDFDNSEPHG
jgi:hypothetical protein